jgi:hypothetical protein
MPFRSSGRCEPESPADSQFKIRLGTWREVTDELACKGLIDYSQAVYLDHDHRRCRKVLTRDPGNGGNVPGGRWALSWRAYENLRSLQDQRWECEILLPWGQVWRFKRWLLGDYLNPGNNDLMYFFNPDTR